MIIVLEGADCSGKTTLAEELKLQASCEVVYEHNTEKTNSLAHFHEQILRMSDWEDKLCIIDRLWISEQIYGQFMRQNGGNDPNGVIMATCNNFDVVHIMCVRQDVGKHLYHFKEVAKTREEYAARAIEDIIRGYYDLWYGNRATKLEGQVGFLARHMPLRCCKAFVQYDMDTMKPESFAHEFMRRYM
jgi:thymidylate kinase